jgi:hypothetical protein
VIGEHTTIRARPGTISYVVSNRKTGQVTC